MKRKLEIALASPRIKLADPVYNAESFSEYAKAAFDHGADVIAFPELAITGATCMDLFCQELLILKAEEALELYIEKTSELDIISFIGLPLSIDGILYNAVAAVRAGNILGITLSGSHARCFAPAPADEFTITVVGKSVTVGRDLVFEEKNSGARILVKIGDDDAFSISDVDLILNPVAMTEYVGAKKKRRGYAIRMSASLGTSFAVVGAGIGEIVLITTGSSARLALHNKETPTDAVVVGIVD